VVSEIIPPATTLSTDGASANRPLEPLPCGAQYRWQILICNAPHTACIIFKSKYTSSLNAITEKEIHAVNFLLKPAQTLRVSKQA
jgi:hypothetical protein